MAMVFSVCPGRFRTAQTLTVGADKPGSAIRITDCDKISGMSESEEKKLIGGPRTVTLTYFFIIKNNNIIIITMLLWKAC